MQSLRPILLCSLCCLLFTPKTEAAKRRFIAADSSKKRIAIIDEDGKIVWQRKIGPLHDLQVLPNGNILMQNSWTHLIEVNPKTNKVVWEYDAAKNHGNAGKRVEVHAFQRLKNGDTMIVESGSARMIEVDQHGKLKKSFKLEVKKPHPHRTATQKVGRRSLASRGWSLTAFSRRAAAMLGTLRTRR